MSVEMNKYFWRKLINMYISREKFLSSESQQYLPALQEFGDS